MSKAPVDAKKTMLLHSEAKVEFLKKYLQRYLRILYRAEYVSEINIFDAFCGTGIYDNGKKGSPLVAFETIRAIRKQYDFEKPINLFVNDSQLEKVDAVKKHLDTHNQNYCSISYFQLLANEMFQVITTNIQNQSRNARNLIFIDPYGYKEIKRAALEQLLGNQRTEIILFLPISQMQRFTYTAVSSELKPYEPLKEFVYSFFPADHPLKERTVSPLTYVEFVKDALKFDHYYSTSYYIERDDANYYALFFISPHLYGFEKILEVKWQLDEDSGRGFRQPSAPTLFDEEDKKLQRNDNYKELEGLLEEFLETPRTNQDTYRFVLNNEFLPKHAGEIFRTWQDAKPNFSVVDFATREPVRKRRFYINWAASGPTKPPKVLFSLK